MLIPMTSTTSAEPHLELMLRLPCVATRTPATAVTGAVGIDQRVRFFHPRIAACVADGERFESIACYREWSGGRADRFGEADDLLDGLAFHAEGDQQGRDLGVGTLSGEDVRHHGAR